MDVIPFHPIRSVTFQSSVHLRCRPWCGQVPETVAVEAVVDMKDRAVVDLTIVAYGSDYTEHLTDAQMQELEDEALYHAEALLQ